MPSRLSRHAGTCASCTVSVCVLVAHALFFYAQYSGMSTECGPSAPLGPGPCAQNVPLDPGGLLRADLRAHVEYDASGLLEPGLQALTSAMCYEKGIYTSCPEGRHTPLGNLSDPAVALCGVLECGGLDYAEALIHISYFYSIEHLWSQPGTPGALPWHDPYGYYPGRPASGTLFFWSFLWPHTKLLLLHAFWYLRLRAPVRRNGNFWFGFFGKWSLADVLAMAALLALFDLDVDMPMTQLWDALHVDFLPLCDAICLAGFHNGTVNVSQIDFHNGSAPLPPSNCSMACHVASVALTAGVTPANLPSSQVHINLRMEGLAAMYAFCLAVLISLTTGVWVDTLDDELREAQQLGGRGARKDPLSSGIGFANGAVSRPRGGVGWTTCGGRDSSTVDMDSTVGSVSTGGARSLASAGAPSGPRDHPTSALDGGGGGPLDASLLATDAASPKPEAAAALVAVVGNRRRARDEGKAFLSHNGGLH